MKKHFFSFLSFVLLSFSCQAQFISDLIDPSFLNPAFRRGQGKNFDKIDGTPYLLEDWKRGKIILATGQAFDNINLKYDIYSDEVVVVGPENQEAAFNKNKIESFIIYGSEEMPEYRFVKWQQGDFYNLVYEGKSKVYQKFKKRVHTAEVNSGGFGSSENKSTFLNDNKLFIQTPSGEIKEFDKEKKLYEIYPKNTEQIKAFIKSNKIKFKTAANLAEVVRYIDSL